MDPKIINFSLSQEELGRFLKVAFYARDRGIDEGTACLDVLCDQGALAKPSYAAAKAEQETRARLVKHGATREREAILQLIYRVRREQAESGNEDGILQLVAEKIARRG